jgi:hypothetical protein
MGAEPVNVDNFERAETNRMFAAILRDTAGVNQWMHNREPTPLDHQPVIRQNRDTLYSTNVFDASGGAVLTLPDSGGRYLSAMVVNQDHYVMQVLHDSGEHPITADDIGTGHALVALRILVDPNDPADVAVVNGLQDQARLDVASAQPVTSPDYDETSFTATRDALLRLAGGLQGFPAAFGRPDQVDPVHHLLGTAAGWGGLPDDEAMYENVNPGLPVGDYELTVGDVPVDAFWSISVYNATGYFEQGLPGGNSLNSVTAARDLDGTVTVRFGGGPPTGANFLSIMDGWNYLVRLYRPRPEARDGSWTFPSISGG